MQIVIVPPIEFFKQHSLSNENKYEYSMIWCVQYNTYLALPILKSLVFSFSLMHFTVIKTGINIRTKYQREIILKAQRSTPYQHRF